MSPTNTFGILDGENWKLETETLNVFAFAKKATNRNRNREQNCFMV